MARRPQINFQVDEAMKALYEEVRACGHWATRWCAAGFLLMVERPDLRLQAFDRLREWEEQFEEADAEQIRAFVAAAQRTASPAGTARARRSKRGH